ncbi:cytochrome P450 2K1-like isoform X2 [Acanthochromis polyacanthus]|uniref:cytochrome P450 2K1-like isoform X2 n=1 Tax=Acanthochromis polyacanthus TaxID=80966 RepID=UPI002233ECC2|nr:cytochrome P450 2K1-like isoform X2 [Acanthochromis polyacanthus]
MLLYRWVGTVLQSHCCDIMEGILFANGESWKEMRRFALSTLKDFGMGKRVCEEKILEECGHLMEMFEQHEGKPFDTTRPVNCTTANIISSIVYGSRFEQKDPRFIDMVSRTTEMISVAGSASVQFYNMFPRMLRWVKNRRVILNHIENNERDVKDLVKHLKETLNPNMCRGFVDCFLIRQQKDQDSGVPDSLYSDKNLVISVTNLFAAGTDTTSSTLRWALLFMAKYPQIQDQVQEELDRVAGGRRVRMDDRRNLPFTDAVIHETQRMANILPLAIPHQTSRDVTFQGYFIKQGTTVLPLLASVLYDESEWESPHTFNPAHFLNQEGRFIWRDAFMAFSAGRRTCVGESLARMELFLFFTSLLQHFRFTAPPGVSEDQLDITPAVGFTLSPPPQQLCAVRRC